MLESALATPLLSVLHEADVLTSPWLLSQTPTFSGRPPQTTLFNIVDPPQQSLPHFLLYLSPWHLSLYSIIYFLPIFFALNLS